MNKLDKLMINRRQAITATFGGAAALSLAACGGSGSAAGSAASGGKIKVGLICLHDENSTYDLNFIKAFKESCEKMGVGTEGQDFLIKTGVPENNECYDAAAELVEAGCKLIFADSFGHEDYMIQAAKEFPEVQFCHATGTKAHTEKLPNYHNAFAAIYEGRYLAGVAAGLKLKEMIDAGTITADKAKMGYVGAFTYAEVISGYTSFFLGAKSIVPEVTMDVTFTGSWYDQPLEQEGATKLINGGCVLISQHADSMGAPQACENANVPNVSYNGSTKSSCPKTYIISSRINWSPYYEEAIGGYTTDVLLLRHGKPDMQFCRSLESGIITMNNEIIRKVNSLHDLLIDDEHISAVLQGEDTILSPEVKATILSATELHANSILNQLRELQVDLRSNPAVFIGGGSLLLRPFLTRSPLVARADFIDSPAANALGYQMLAKAAL